MKQVAAYLRPVIFCFLLLGFTSASQKEAYKIYSGKGKEVSYTSMVEKLAEADVVLFGELHNNPICHWLELTVMKDLHERKTDMIVGAEMFEADDQLKLDEFIGGKITITQLSKEAKVWDNFRTDYEPLLKYAASGKLKFVATNIPRRYASLVAREGFGALDSLQEEAKKYLAPLPIETDLNLPGYKALETSHNHHRKTMGLPFMPHAQAIKDATMAYFILKNLPKGKLFLHFNGAYHSMNYEGIYWHLKKKSPTLKIVTITSVEQNRVDKLEEDYKGQSDYILCIPSDMTKTY